MEIKAQLLQPYTDKEREDFIVEQNHKLGYEIRQVETTYEVEEQVPCIVKETITEIIQVPVLDENDNPILDEDGNPTFEEKTVEREVERIETEIVTEEIQAPVLDDEGNLTFETQTVEKEVVKYKTEIVEKIGYNLEAWGYTENEIQEQERERIAKLSMTKREMFLGLYNAKGITPDDLKKQITDPAALIEFEYANDYYRGNPLIDIIGTQLGFTTEQLDKFFETKDYTYLLPIEDNTTTEGGEE